MTENTYTIPLAICDGQLLKTRLASHYSGHRNSASHSYNYEPAPVLVKPAYLLQMAHLCTVLNKALTAVVNAYFKDERIRAIYGLDATLEQILQIASERPYATGLYRPDLVIDHTGQPRICEIGARYPINGWMLSYYLNLTCSEADIVDPEIAIPVPGIGDFIDTLYDFFDAATPLALVHDNEKGTEVYNLLAEFEKKGKRYIDVSPANVSVKDGRIYAADTEVTDVILEMDREELRKFDPAVLAHIIRYGNYINDVRTLILVHDKRILAVLYDAAIMADHLQAADYVFLRQFLIPTFPLNSEARRAEMITSPKNWLVKETSGGRGIGIYIKNETTPEAWADIVNNEWRRYMVQEYVDQPFFDLEGTINEPMNIVGMLLCYNDRSFGPGLCRGSSANIVNAHCGRAAIFPTMILSTQAT